MSYLLKRTKRTCVKLIRKLSSSKQTYCKQVEEDDQSTATEAEPTTHIHDTPPPAINASEAKWPCSSEPKMCKKRNSTESLPLPTYCCRSYEHAEDVIDDKSKADRRQGITMLQSLTSKLFLTANGYEFQHLQQKRRDNISEVHLDESEKGEASQVSTANGSSLTSAPTSTDAVNEQCSRVAAVRGIVFERVKYREDVRYFCHTPSSSSPDNISCRSNLFTYNTTASPTSNTTYVTADTAIPTPRIPASGQECIESTSYFLPMNVSLGSKLNGNFQNVCITEELDYYNKLQAVVKWDINGNSLDDESIFINHSWDDFDFEHGGAPSRFSQLEGNHCVQIRSDDSQKSLSYRSSSSTLETWLDDEYNEADGLIKSAPLHNQDYEYARCKHGLMQPA